MEYIIVSADDRHAFTAKKELEKKVNERLKDGWVLQGGVSTYVEKTQYIEHHHADQAMVKYPNHPTINMN